MTKRQYKTPAEAAAEGLFSCAELRKQFRLKPAKGQYPACNIWQGIRFYSVYAKADCVPMRPARPLTDKQRAALAAGRWPRVRRHSNLCPMRQSRLQRMYRARRLLSL